MSYNHRNFKWKKDFHIQNFFNKYQGILDQGTGALILFEAKPIDMVYDNSLSIIQSIGKVVDNLYVKVKKLS